MKSSKLLQFNLTVISLVKIDYKVIYDKVMKIVLDSNIFWRSICFKSKIVQGHIL